MSKTLARSLTRSATDNEVYSVDRESWCPKCDRGTTLTIVVAGASGDLAAKKTFPALQFLFCNNFFPPQTRIIGYARSNLTNEALCEKLRPKLKGTPEAIDRFLSKVSYISGPYDGDNGEGYTVLEQAIRAHELENDGCPAGRLYYLALPPSAYPDVCTGLKTFCDGVPTTPDSWIRVIVEKPFGRDLKSSEELADIIGPLYPESQLYRIDHYLGKEMLQNLFVLRFANGFFSPMWNRNSVANVQITFKEDFGTQGRGGYFDSFGIIRDVIQNHLIQVLAFVCMEKPVSIHPDDIRDEKVKVLRSVRPASEHYTVLGQYTAGQGEEGYLEDPTVPDDSKTPTFASCVLFIDNDRWAGVPFCLKAGKALNERKAEVRLQLRAPPHSIFPHEQEHMRNEFVVRLQPDEAIYMKTTVKSPGLEMDTEISELDLDYRNRYPTTDIPDAYPRLILEAIRGDQQHFVRRDELRAAWAIFDDLLKNVDAGEVPVLPYEAGSRGPVESDELLTSVGYIRPRDYAWKASQEMKKIVE